MRKVLFALLAASLTVALAPQAQAKWPEKPVRLILPFGAGGVADVTSRIMAAKLSEKFGQQVVIENMPGPGGINAARAVITAAPDGYTLALVTNGTSISVAAFNKLPFDPVKDLVPVSMVGTFDLVFAVDAKSEFKTLQDFMIAAKANPGKFNVGTVLLGGTQNLGGELFKSMTGTPMLHVPYRSSPQAIADLIAGEANVLFDNLTSLSPHAKSGRVRPLAVSGSHRSPLFPELPTIAEAGVPGYETMAWGGVIGPAKLPTAIVARLNREIVAALHSPSVTKRFAELDTEIDGSTPEQFAAIANWERPRWAEIIKRAGAKIE
jgi:tripartite-type tricarboxylate transporter receptor subunit TctC